MSAIDYVRFVFLDFLLNDEFDQAFANGWIEEHVAQEIFDQSLERSIHEMGYSIDNSLPELRDEAIKRFVVSNSIQVEGDDYTGVYYKLNVSTKDKYIKEFIANDPVSSRLSKLGRTALDRALHKVSSELGWSKILEVNDESNSEYSALEFHDIHRRDFQVPASDRVVTISHNQQQEIIVAVNDVEEALKKENSIEGDSAVRERFIAQISAGRELIRASSVRAYLVYETLVRLLGALIQKYKDKALGVTAAKLLDLLLEHIFEK